MPAQLRGDAREAALNTRGALTATLVTLRRTLARARRTPDIINISNLINIINIVNIIKTMNIMNINININISININI